MQHATKQSTYLQVRLAFIPDSNVSISSACVLQQNGLTMARGVIAARENVVGTRMVGLNRVGATDGDPLW